MEHGLSSCGARAQYLWSVGSVVVECGLSSCGVRAWLPCGMWDVPGSGIHPVSPALAGDLFTTEPSGRPPEGSFNIESGNTAIGKCKGREGKEDSEDSTSHELQQFRCTCVSLTTNLSSSRFPGVHNLELV